METAITGRPVSCFQWSWSIQNCTAQGHTDLVTVNLAMSSVAADHSVIITTSASGTLDWEESVVLLVFAARLPWYRWCLLYFVSF